MKKLFNQRTTITIITLLFISLLADGQTIRRVNNNLGISGINVYTTAQAAHDAAVAGDIIYLEPSSPSNLSYGSLDVTKTISIVSNGYFLDKNPNTPSDTRTPTLSQVAFLKGSAKSTMTGVDVSSSFSVKDSQIVISRCKITGVSLGIDGNSPVAKGNYLTVSKSLITGGLNGSNMVGCTFSNNLIVNGNSQALITSFVNSIFIYNTYIPVGYAQFGGQIGGVIGCTFSNNTFDWRNYTYGLANLIYNYAGTNFSNNVSIGYSGLPVGNGNINGAATANFYANSNPLLNYTTLGETVFQPGTGAVGTNVGAFSGPSPYILSGLPPIPIITNLIVSGVGNSTTPLNVSLTVRGNN